MGGGGGESTSIPSTPAVSAASLGSIQEAVIYIYPRHGQGGEVLAQPLAPEGQGGGHQAAGEGGQGRQGGGGEGRRGGHPAGGGAFSTAR